MGPRDRDTQGKRSQAWVLRQVAGRTDKGNRVWKHRGRGARPCGRVWGQEEAEVGCGLEGPGESDHQGPEVSEGFPVRC